MPVSASFIRKELKSKMPIYNKIKDCIEGETKIKSKKTKYLPSPCLGENNSVRRNGYENLEQRRNNPNHDRYSDYLERANFFNATARTLEGLVGAVFSIDPVIEVPQELENIIDDVNGDNVSIVQQAKRACDLNLSLGRAGLFVDFANTENGFTKDDVNKGTAKPTIKLINPEDIINWDTVKKGSKTFYSLIVIVERYQERSESKFFELVDKRRYRVLSLGGSDKRPENEDKYVVEIWEDDSGDDRYKEQIIPLDFSGNPFDEIPFFFVGSKNNDHNVDNPPMSDIADVNISHYRNSADYEESCFIAGQPTLYLTGLNESWVTNQLNNHIAIGSRSAIPLPQGATAGLLQAQPNTLPFEAMQHKEKQLVALGAKLVQNREVQRTASEARQDKSSENSILATVAKNVSEGFVDALKFAYRFVSASEDPEVIFALNTDFNIATLPFENIMKIVSMYQQGVISFKEIRDMLRKTSIATEDDLDVRSEIDKEREIDLKLVKPNANK